MGTLEESLLTASANLTISHLSPRSLDLNQVGQRTVLPRPSPYPDKESQLSQEVNLAYLAYIPGKPEGPHVTLATTSTSNYKLERLFAVQPANSFDITMVLDTGERPSCVSLRVLLAGWNNFVEKANPCTLLAAIGKPIRK